MGSRAPCWPEAPGERLVVVTGGGGNSAGPGTPTTPAPPPTWTPPQPLLYPPPPFALPEPPLRCPPPPPPQGASGQQLVGGVVGVQNRGVAPPGVVVLDSEYVCNGIGQVETSWEVGHRGLREHILWLREDAGGELLQVRWGLGPAQSKCASGDRVSLCVARDGTPCPASDQAVHQNEGRIWHRPGFIQGSQRCDLWQART